MKTLILVLIAGSVVYNVILRSIKKSTNRDLFSNLIVSLIAIFLLMKSSEQSGRSPIHIFILVMVLCSFAYSFYRNRKSDS